MNNIPYTFGLNAPAYVPSHYDNYIQRRLSDMKGQYLDQGAFSMCRPAGRIARSIPARMI